MDRAGLRVPLLSAIGLLACATMACAEGTTRVQQSNGSVVDYPGVRFTVAGHALTLTSADGLGSLRIAVVNCVPSGTVQRCEPGGAEYTQNGQIRALDLSKGTLYINTTSEKKTLTHSSTQVPPYGVILTLQTTHGTYISATATIDGLKKK